MVLASGLGVHELANVVYAYAYIHLLIRHLLVTQHVSCG